MSFDESGKLYVVEMCDYSEQRNDFLGSIKLLEDTDGDGRFDKSTTFIDHLSWPSAVICYDGGVFIERSRLISFIAKILTVTARARYTQGLPLPVLVEQTCRD